jgi:hypothetical protein
MREKEELEKFKITAKMHGATFKEEADKNTTNKKAAQQIMRLFS